MARNPLIAVTEIEEVVVGGEGLRRPRGGRPTGVPEEIAPPSCSWRRRAARATSPVRCCRSLGAIRGARFAFEEAHQGALDLIEPAAQAAAKQGSFELAVFVGLNHAWMDIA